MTKLNPFDQSTVDTIMAMPLAEYGLAMPASAKAKLQDWLECYVGSEQLSNDILSRTRDATLSVEEDSVVLGGQFRGTVVSKWIAVLKLGSPNYACGELVLSVGTGGHSATFKSGRADDDVARVLGLRA